MPIFSPMMINTIRVLLVGTVLARGQLGGGFIGNKDDNPSYRVTGRVIRVESAEDAVKAPKFLLHGIWIWLLLQFCVLLMA